MKILVLIKEVPDMEKVRFDSERGVIDRSSAEAEINPFDENALQAAIDLKRIVGGEVTVMTMGPPKAEGSLRDGYARGADRCVLVTDRSFGGSDTCATARTLAAAISMLGGFDLILCGEKSVDGDTAQVGAETAEFLDIPHAYYVEDIQWDSQRPEEVVVLMENLGGSSQLRRIALPAVLGVTKNINIPKLPTVRRKLESRRVPIQVLTMKELSGYLKEQETGFQGSPTKVARIHIPAENKKENQLFREDLAGFLEKVDGVFSEKGIR